MTTKCHACNAPITGATYLLLDGRRDYKEYCSTACANKKIVAFDWQEPVAEISPEPKGPTWLDRLRKQW